MQAIRTQVLIVGAGPIGMALALDLGKRGVECLLIEQGDGSIVQPKIGLMAVRTMEFFRHWGIADEVRNCGFPDDYDLSMVFCTSLNGYHLEREPYPAIRDLKTPEWTTEKKQRCPQIWLNPILQRAVERTHSVTLKFGCRLDSFDQSESKVSAQATLTESNEKISIEADYMVGCDGAGSAVRNALGIDMLGNAKLSYSISILVQMKGMFENTKMGQAERYLFVGPDGTWGNWTVIDGKDLWRLTILGTPEKMDIENFDARAWVKRALGRSDIDFEVLWVLPWRRSELIAERYRDRRVLLAGDSAHTMSPTGGMGMNTGMGDAVDLGWKLEASLHGWAGEDLLDSYEIERKPIAVRNAAFSTHNWNSWKVPKDPTAVLDDTEEGARLREEIGAGLRTSTRADWESWGLQMGYRYDGSPIVISDDSEPTPDDYIHYIPTARPGGRAPHAVLKDGRSTLDLFGDSFVLLQFSDDAKSDADSMIAAARQKGMPLKVVVIEDKKIADLYECRIVLVRPDGHVAWRGDRVQNASEIVDVIRGKKALPKRKNAPGEVKTQMSY